MFVIRPISHDDLSALETFSLHSGVGLTSLPPDRSLLHQKILRSEHSFASKVLDPGPELYQFVLEDTSVKQVVGTCAIVARTGWKEPLAFFQVKCESKKCLELGFCKKHNYIEPVSYSKGPSEVCTLYLANSHRKGGLGYLLSLSRFLFMASFPERFNDRVIAEMRGVIDEDGRSPFYEAVMRPFFDLDFAEIQDLLAVDRTFIQELLPYRPIYLSILPKEAREVISKTHPKTTPALRLLEGEGFAITSDIDLFDAGPKIEAQTAEIRSVKGSQLARVVGISQEPADTRSFILCNGKIDFRACLGHLVPAAQNEVLIDAETARVLGVARGDTIRYIEPKPKATQARKELWQEAPATPL
ncbi:MAG: arginine N-succinyltransferase [Chlamydiia bacterium]|nr:arginine N-succinyltransferase [Chlamydiia bacterium]